MNYAPIKEKIEAWIWYDEHEPKSDYRKCNEFRRKYDLDCILTGGNLNADTIFSLWRPLRFTLVRINGYPKLNKYGTVKKNADFLRKICNDTVLREILPNDTPMVINLARLFELGQTRANIMILPQGYRKLNLFRNDTPYHDYVPYFLYECFKDGYFSYAFQNDDTELINWINNENLRMFFDGKPCRENLKDLAKTGDIKSGLPKDLNVLFENYINLLEERNI